MSSVNVVVQPYSSKTSQFLEGYALTIYDAGAIVKRIHSSKGIAGLQPYIETIKAVGIGILYSNKTILYKDKVRYK